MVLAKLKTRSLLSNRRADCTKYTYDAALNRKLMIDSNSTTTYTCDVANQLNLIVETTGRTTISYDANGNQILQVMPVLSRTTNVWDGDNRLANVVHSSTDRSTYSYWSDSLRVSAVENGAIVKFTWDEQRYLQEANAVNETQALFTSEPTLYGSLISQTRSLTTFFHTDSTGSVTYLTDVDSTVTDSYLFRAFGAIVNSIVLSINSFMYVGATGFYNVGTQYYVRNRWMSPFFSKWYSIDPISSSYNNYAYGDNNPINNVDPSGMLVYSHDRSPVKYGCGNFFWPAWFSLNPAQKNGFIIQHIKQVGHVRHCCPDRLKFRTLRCPSAYTFAIDGPAQVNEYWELWEVIGGKIWVTGNPPAINSYPTIATFSDDDFVFDAGGLLTYSRTTYSMEGRLYWFSGIIPPGGWVFWNLSGTAGHDSVAGDLPTSCVQPPGIVDTGSGRYVRVSWNCCSLFNSTESFDWKYTNT